MDEYRQMEMDFTLEPERNLKENIQTVIRFALDQIMQFNNPPKVRNRHEAYGIAAEEMDALARQMKQAQNELKSMLAVLPNGEGDILNITGSLYNSAAEVAAAAVKLAAQSQRILNDLYYGEDGKTPIERYLEDQEGEDDGFEDAEEMDSDEENKEE